MFFFYKKTKTVLIKNANLFFLTLKNNGAHALYVTFAQFLLESGWHHYTTTNHVRLHLGRKATTFEFLSNFRVARPSALVVHLKTWNVAGYATKGAFTPKVHVNEK